MSDHFQETIRESAKAESQGSHKHSQIAQGLDAAIQHHRWQADAIQFQARCRISCLHAENLHPAYEWLSRTRILATGGDKSPARIDFGVGFVP
jgi:hypothetical protein